MQLSSRTLAYSRTGAQEPGLLPTNRREWKQRMNDLATVPTANEWTSLHSVLFC